LRNGWEKRQFLALRFCGDRRKGSALKNLTGALHADGVECTLSVGWEVKMEIPAKGKPKGGLMLFEQGVRTDDFAIAPDGTIYIPSGTKIMKVSPTGEVSQFLDNVPNGASAWVTKDGKWLYWAT
jgi:hypothetical protein